MKQGYEKYIPFKPISLPDRTWPNKQITKAPTWCSVDLRDGNQALVTPMNLQEKLDFFKLLVDVGFRKSRSASRPRPKRNMRSCARSSTADTSRTT